MRQLTGDPLWPMLVPPMTTARDWDGLPRFSETIRLEINLRRTVTALIVLIPDALPAWQVRDGWFWDEMLRRVSPPGSPPIRDAAASLLRKLNPEGEILVWLAGVGTGLYEQGAEIDVVLVAKEHPPIPSTWEGYPVHVYEPSDFRPEG